MGRLRVLRQMVFSALSIEYISSSEVTIRPKGAYGGHAAGVGHELLDISLDYIPGRRNKIGEDKMTDLHADFGEHRKGRKQREHDGNQRHQGQ